MATNVKMEKNTLLYVKLRDVCRTCFISNGKLYSIFDNENLIITMLNSISETKIEKENCNKDMPSKICENCLKNLNNLFQFKQKCKDAETKIGKMFSCFNKINRNEYIYLIKNLDLIDQNIIVKQMIESNSNTFECDGHIVFKTNANLDQSIEYKSNESLDKNDLSELYEEKYHDENDSVDITEFKHVITKEENNIFQTDVKYEPNLSPKSEQNTHNLIYEIEEANFNNIKTRTNTKLKSGSKLNAKKSCNTKKCNVNKSIPKSKKNSDNLVSKLKEKLKSLTPKERNLVCLICKRSFSQMRILKAHVQTHISEEMAAFPCKQCGKKFKMRHNLIRHEKIHTGERPYKCEICNKSFIQSFTLKEHMFIHNEAKGCECSVCHKVFGRPAALKQHQKKYQHVSSLDTSHQCTICLKSFSSFLGLNAHARVHSVDSTFECTKCQIKFSSGHFLTEHNLLHHGENKLSDKDFTCSICDKKLVSFAALVSHQEVHDSNASFLCNFCGKSCRTKYNFTIHLRRHTGERPFPCEHCTKKFISKAALDNHKNSIHSDIRRYTCDVCRKKFRQLSHLIVHKRIHTDERPFGCEFCSKRFRIKHAADVHLRIHTGEKPYSCENCTQTFSDPSSFRKHTQKCKDDMKISKQELNE